MDHEKDKELAHELRQLGHLYRKVLAKTHQDALNHIDEVIAKSPNQRVTEKSLRANREFNEKRAWQVRDADRYEVAGVSSSGR
jgi:hypothetical protein